MKKLLQFFAVLTIIITAGFFYSTNTKKEQTKVIPIEYNFSREFKEYWIAGKAELSSYELSKARYGEIRSGEAVLVLVVEPFLPEEQVKSDGLPSDEKPERVMKLINSQKFYTGIYPYSIMTSSFYPLNENRNGVLKVSMSSQDWCGQVYSQVNRKNDFLKLKRYSYFQKEGDVNVELEKGLMEEEIFTMIRLNPLELPTGDLAVYPSSEYIRLTHKEIKKYNAKASLDTNGNEYIYKLTYSNLDRELVVKFESSFPHKILEWEETYSDFSGKKLTSTAKLKESIQLDYWKYNSVKDSTYREILALR